MAVDDYDAWVAARGATLVAMARGLLRDPHDAEDVVQDVLVKLHLHWASVQRAGDPEAYVRRALVNACTSFWRGRVRRDRAFGLLGARGVSDTVADSSAASAERDRMVTLLRRLPPKQRAVLVLRHYGDLDDAAVAQAMGISVQTVRSNAHRGLARLREFLDAEEVAS